MKHKHLWYSLILGILFSFCFGTSVFAATSQISASGTDADGNTVQFVGNTFTNQQPDEVFEQSDIPWYTYKWNLAQNIDIKNLRQGKYYNGRIILTVTDNPTNATRNRVSIASSHVAEGLYIFLDTITNTSYRVCIIFDNFYTTDSTVGMPSILTEYLRHGDQSYSNINTSTNSSLAVTYINGFSGTDYPLPSGFADVLSHMIGYALSTNYELDDIVSLLTTIRNQDLTYYTNLTSSVSSILSELGTHTTVLNNILNEMDLDFQSVQTVLDLFPAYSQSVLNYWQQFLQMNASQASEAAEQESKYADGESQANNMVSNMEVVGLPSISSGDLDILGTIDGTQKNNFFGVIALITHTEIVTKIMLIIVIGAMVGFIMYGKKGG